MKHTEALEGGAMQTKDGETPEEGAFPQPLERGSHNSRSYIQAPKTSDDFVCQTMRFQMVVETPLVIPRNVSALCASLHYERDQQVF